MTMYQSSKGPVEIATMPLRYARNALDKLHRECSNGERGNEIDALIRHVAKLAAGADAMPEPTKPRTVGDILNDMPIAGVGHNGAPETTPLEAHTANINDLYDEAKNFLDGEAIENQGQADAVTKLLDDARKAGKAADAQRVVEKKPHDDASKEVQKAWKPLIDKAERIETGTKAALGQWLIAEQAKQKAIADEARRVADAAAEAARVVHQEAAKTGDLGALEDAEHALKDARTADRDANRAEREKPVARVEGMARNVSLRTVWDVTLADDVEGEVPADRQLAAHFWRTERSRVLAFYMQLAEEAVRGGARVIPGTAITSRQVAR